MRKGPKKSVLVVGKAQRLLHFLEAYKGKPVFYGLHFYYNPFFNNLFKTTIYLRYYTSDYSNSCFTF